MVMKGKMNRSLYALEGSTISGSTNVSTNTMFDHETKLWHLRLSHMGERGMYELSKQRLFDGISSETLGFVNNVFMGNTRRLVSNLPYTTLREY